jgi:hypothetical protein
MRQNGVVLKSRCDRQGPSKSRAWVKQLQIETDPRTIERERVCSKIAHYPAGSSPTVRSAALLHPQAQDWSSRLSYASGWVCQNAIVSWSVVAPSRRSSAPSIIKDAPFRGQRDNIE